MRLWLALLVVAAGLHGQKPVIFPGGVVNAASYATGRLTGKGLAGDSIVSIFGSNLASTEQVASGFPLPTTLGGVSVTLNGVAARIFYVSPRQINIQLPWPPPAGSAAILVTTPAGASDPAFVDGGEVFGIFTLDGSGCGQGAVLNVASDGSVSVNSPANSASPGDFISVYGTGLGAVFNPPPAGSPALANPLSLALNWSLYSAAFDLPPPTPPTPLRTRVSWAGRAPGLVGVDQVNVQIPEIAREGCAVPLSIGAAYAGRSQPVLVGIRRGGGACEDPPSAGFGQITWERTITSGTTPSGETDVLTAAFPASPGKQAPPPTELLPPGVCRINITDFFGAACPLPGYRGLDAGRVTVQGPGFGSLEAVPASIDGQMVYRAVLPSGAIRPGSFGVAASGGNDVGPFQSSVQIGSGINITSLLAPGTVLFSRQPITVNWTGGDPDTWVTMRVVRPRKVADNYSICQARASDGTITLGTAGGFLPPGPGPAEAEIILEVTPHPSQAPTLSARGLSLGGQHLWKYTYRFGGLTIQ